MTKESTKSNDFSPGDFVAVYFANDVSVIGVVLGEARDNQWNGRRCAMSMHPEIRERIINNPTPRILNIRIKEYGKEAVFAEECRKLSGKEIFKAKLSDDWDYLLRYDNVSI